MIRTIGFGTVGLLAATTLAAGTASASPARDSSSSAAPIVVTCFVNHDFTVAWSAAVGGNIVARLGKGQGFDYRLDTRYRKLGNLWGGPANVFIDHEDLNC